MHAKLITTNRKHVLKSTLLCSVMNSALMQFSRPHNLMRQLHCVYPIQKTTSCERTQSPKQVQEKVGGQDLVGALR